MIKEHGGHPENWLHEELFTSVRYNLSTARWFSRFESVIQDVESLSDERSVTGVLRSMSQMLKLKVKTIQNGEAVYSELMEKRIIPLWERELGKRDSWIYYPSDIYEFATTVGGDRAIHWLLTEAALVIDKLPPYEILPSVFPDEGISDGLEAVMRGKNKNGFNWYAYMNDLFSFCKLGDHAADIIRLCEANGWTNEQKQWQQVKEYFTNFLLYVNLSAIDPRVIDGMKHYIFQKDVSPESKRMIQNRLSSWQIARIHTAGDIVVKDPKQYIQ